MTTFTRTILGVVITGVTSNGTVTGFRSDDMKVGIKHVIVQQEHSWKFRSCCHKQVLSGVN